MTVLKWSLGLLVAASAIVAVTVRLSGAVAFNPGDVLAAVGNGQVKHFTPTGTLLETLDDTTGSQFTTGMCFDSAGNLFVTNFDANLVSKFNNTGDLVSANFISGITSSPESCVVDAAGNIYVGVADGDGDIRKYDAAGTLLAQFDVATELRGSDWIDLAADQCTMFYTSEGFTIKRYDVCTSTQLSDFATGLTGNIFAFRILPDGGVLVAETSQVQRLDSSGAVVSTYIAPGGTFLFALNRDPNGTQFWTGDLFSGEVFLFNISPSGPPVSQFNAGILTALGGLAIFGELVVSQPTPTPTVLAATATATPTVPTPTPTSVPPTSTATPTATPTPPPPAGGAICRSPGFWGTHGGTEKSNSTNITQALLDAYNGANAADPLTICGTDILNTDVGSVSSALEAICVSPKGNSLLQLARQLTATALNCIITNSQEPNAVDCPGAGLEGPVCDGVPIGDFFDACNEACEAGELTVTIDSQVISCIGALECINNGGSFEFDDALGEFVCLEVADSCHDRALDQGCFDFEPSGSAGSSGACSDARKNDVNILQ
jgi:hypothetical protein